MVLLCFVEGIQVSVILLEVQGGPAFIIFYPDIGISPKNNIAATFEQKLEDVFFGGR